MAYRYLHTRTCIISRTQVCTDELVHTYVRTSVYAAYRLTCKYNHLYLSLIKERKTKTKKTKRA